MSKDEKKDIYTVVESFSFKKIMRYRYLLLLLFFLFVGITSYIILTSEAEKLAGGKRYSELTASKTSMRFNLIEKIKYAFTAITSQETASLKKDEKDNEEMKEQEENYNEEEQTSSIENSNTSSNSSSKTNTSRSPYNQYISYSGTLNKANLQSSLMPLSFENSQTTSKTSLSKFELSRSANVKIKNTDGKIGISYGKKSEQEQSAINALKSTFKTSLMAARDASNDTARAWIAKAFDATPQINQTIEYDEKLRASLDRINPNSIPAFLKDPSLDAKEMKTLKESDIPDPSFKEEEEDKEKELFDKGEIKDLLENYKKGILKEMEKINPLFAMNLNQKGGLLNNNEGEFLQNNPNSLPDTITLPDQSPNLGQEALIFSYDEYGNIRVSNPDGTIYIFDVNTGRILGCEDPNLGMCLLPGAATCPAEIYFV